MENKEELLKRIDIFAQERENIEKSCNKLLISAYAEVCKTEILRARIDNSPIAGPIVMPRWLIADAAAVINQQYKYHFYSDESEKEFPHDVAYIILVDNLRHDDCAHEEEEIRKTYFLGKRIY